MPTTTWPTTVLATKLVQEFPTDASEHLGAMFLPLNTTDFKGGQGIRYKRVKAVTGATQSHSLSATPKLVAAQGMDDVLMPPEYWKERAIIDEDDILTLADIMDERELLSRTGRLFAMRAMQLNMRIDTRLEIDRWLSLRNGYLAGVTVGSKIIKKDYGIRAATAASVAWATAASCKPMDDISAAITRMRGTGAQFVDVVMSRAAALQCIAAASIRDLVAGSNFVGQIGLGNIGGLMKTLMQGDTAPKGCASIRNIYVYDGTYVADGGSVTSFLLDDLVHVIGGRNAPQSGAVVPQMEKLGEWASTNHIRSSGLEGGGALGLETGKFLKVIDKTDEDEQVLLTAGIYGAAAIYHPEWIENIDTTP